MRSASKITKEVVGLQQKMSELEYKHQSYRLRHATCLVELRRFIQYSGKMRIK